MVVENIIERIHQTHNTDNSDITLQSNNGKVHTSRLFLASWSKFWKEILLGYDNAEDIVIVIDVSKSVLNKLCEFLSTGKVNISGAQENIEVIEGLEMLLPDLEFSDQHKLIIEDTEETDMETDYDKFRYEVNENFICNICLTYFSTKQKRDNHIENIHTKKNRYKCKVCAKIIYSKDGLVSHMKTHTCSSKHQCPDCKEIYKNKSDLLRHIKSKGHSHLNKHEKEEKRKFECSECDFTTNRVDSLYRHERNVHGLYNKKLNAISRTIEKKGKVVCSKCSRKFTDIKLATEHFLQESCEPIKCKDCGKEFNKRADLKLHIRDIHTGKSFSCPTCDKVFKQIRNMNRHHKKCKLKETESNEEIRKGATLEKTPKRNKANRNKRKLLSKTDTTKLTENKTEVVEKKKEAKKVVKYCTISKTLIQTRKEEADQLKNPKSKHDDDDVWTQSIKNCLKSIDMKKDDDEVENYESDEGDYL